VTVVTDLFALGSTIYENNEIMTGTQPYGQHIGEEVKTLIRKGTFPTVDGIPRGELIRRC
jgi:hypothetical protein